MVTLGVQAYFSPSDPGRQMAWQCSVFWMFFGSAKISIYVCYALFVYYSVVMDDNMRPVCTESVKLSS